MRPSGDGILRAVVHIQEHLDEPLDLRGLANVARYSPWYFHRTFRGIVGEPVMEHVRRLRLERAALRLRYGRERVTKVAFDAGFQSHEAFTRAFHRAFGCSPSSYRHQARLHLPTLPGRTHPAADRLDLRLIHLPARRVAFVRHVGSYGDVGLAWRRITAWAHARGLLSARPLLIGLGYDDPEVTPARKLRYDACIAVDPGVAPDAPVGVMTLAGGAHVMAVHRGPYENLAETYVRLRRQWLVERGDEVWALPTLEVYRSTPPETPPEDLLTEIHVRLAGNRASRGAGDSRSPTIRSTCRGGDA